MEEIYVQRLISLWIEDRFEIPELSEENIAKAVKYEIEEKDGEFFYDTRTDLGPIEVYNKDRELVKSYKCDYNIEQGLEYLREGIIEALIKIENGENEVILGQHVPFSLVVECAEKRGWEGYTDELDSDFNTNGWEVDCWYHMVLPNPNNIKVTIASCLWQGLTTTIYREDE